MNVVAFDIRDQYLSGSISLVDQLNRYNQGDGLSLRSEEYPGLRYNVRLKDVFGGKVQLFEKTSPSFIHPNFSKPPVEVVILVFMVLSITHF